MPDRDGLLALWRRNLPMATERRLDWLYGQGRATNWFVSTDGGDVVGATGLMRRTIKLASQSLVAGQAIDLNVDREHRSVGPAVQLQRALTSSMGPSGMPLVYALPSREAGAVLKRSGYRVLGTLERWAKPLRSAYKLEKYTKSRLLAQVAGVGLDALLWLRSAEFTYRRPTGFRTEVVEHFDSRFDQLWRIASRQFAVIGDRTSAYLEWRFGRCPDLSYRTLCVSDVDQSLLGYAVYNLTDQVFHVADLLYADLPALHVLIAELLQHARDEGAKVISLHYYGNRQLTQLLERYGFQKRSEERQLLGFVNDRAAGKHVPEILNGDNWHFTKADSDTDV